MKWLPAKDDYHSQNRRIVIIMIGILSRLIHNILVLVEQSIDNVFIRIDSTPSPNYSGGVVDFIRSDWYFIAICRREA